MSRTTPLSIAIAIVCALLFVIGLFPLGAGAWDFAHRNAPVSEAREEMNARSTSGDYISPIEYTSTSSIATIEARNLRTKAVNLMIVGTVLMMPLLIMGALNLSKRRT